MIVGRIPHFSIFLISLKFIFVSDWEKSQTKLFFIFEFPNRIYS